MVPFWSCAKKMDRLQRHVLCGMPLLPLVASKYGACRARCGREGMPKIGCGQAVRARLRADCARLCHLCLPAVSSENFCRPESNLPCASLEDICA